jgi:hypothetical protein
MRAEGIEDRLRVGAHRSVIEGQYNFAVGEQILIEGRADAGTAGGVDLDNA